MMAQIGWLRVLGLILACLYAVTGQAQTYRCLDESGRAVFQDRPCLATSVSEQMVPPIDVVEQSSGKHFLWHASVGQGTLYLLGSIHFGRADMYPLPRVMTSAFRRSDTLVVEADVVNVNALEMARVVAEQAMYKDGDNLQQSLSPEMWRRLNKASTKLGMPVELLNKQRPWFASMTLTSLALNKMGFSQQEGIDRHFINLARGKKRVVELEGIEAQLSLFSRFSDAEQIMMLEETLRELESGPEYFDTMLQHWREGDGDGIQSLFNEGVMQQQGSDRFYQLIMVERNRTMTEKLTAMAKEGGSYFVVVGAGHLVGDDGIISMLKEHGYTVEQL